jgi:CBS domain containing-hemolysin-like protein
MSPVFELAIALALVAANAFFVASEFAIVKIRPTRLSELAGEGRRGAKTALAISHRLDAYLSANQLGITLASLALGWLGERAFADLLEPLLGSTEMAVTLAVTLSFVAITFLHTVVGELAPKSLAIQRTELVALWTAVPLRAFYLAAFPIIWFLNNSSALLLRFVGLRPASEAEMVHSPDELRLILQHVTLEPSARRLIDRVFDYTHRLARHVMTLRNDVVVLQASKGFDVGVQVAIAAQYTRYPLLDDEERVIGYVHLKDLFAALAQGARPSLRSIARQPVVVRDDTSLEDIRREIQRRGVHLVIITDAEGAFGGILTLEDLVEEFVGEIRDEQDQGEQPPLVRRDDGGFEVDGRLTLDVVHRELGFGFPDGTIETLGGYVMDRLGRVARVGDTVIIEGFRLTVVGVKDKRIVRLRGDRVSAD